MDAAATRNGRTTHYGEPLEEHVLCQYRVTGLYCVIGRPDNLSLVGTISCHGPPCLCGNHWEKSMEEHIVRKIGWLGEPKSWLQEILEGVADSVTYNADRGRWTLGR